MVVATIVVSLFTLSAPAGAVAQERQPEAQLYQLDSRLEREGCKPPETSEVPPRIDLDGSGRYVDLIATKSKPAYWSSNIPAIEIHNEPATSLSGRTGIPGEDTLILQVAGLPPRPPFSRTVAPKGHVTLQRTDLAALEQAGVVQIQVLRNGSAVSTLYFILRDPDVILFNEDGAFDPAYRSAVVPGFMPCDFKLEYLPTDLSTAQALTIAAPLLPASTFVPIRLELRQTASVTWANLAMLKRDGRQDVELVVLKNGRAIGVLWLTQKAPGNFEQVPGLSRAESAAPPTPPARAAAVEVLLDRLGVASPAFLNRRRPAYIPASAGNVDLVFKSIAPDRTFVITFSGIPEAERPELIGSGAQTTNCRDGKCQMAIRVSPGGSTRLKIVTLRNAYAKSEVGSTVTFDLAFYDDDNTPTNNRGYLTFVDEPYFVEPASTTTWTGALSVSLLNDPDLSGTIPKDRKNPVITSASPWDRINRTHVMGSATLGLKQGLGNRADFEAELTARQGDFGADAGSVGSSKYLANVYADYGAKITGGRFEIAAPTDAIAFSESGDAVNIGGRLGSLPAFASVGYIFKKELPEGSFNVEEVQKIVKAGGTSLDRNNRDVVLQVRDIAVGRTRTAVYGVIGDADRGRLRTDENDVSTLEEFDANYWTAGGHAMLTMGNSLLSVGLYHSERSGDAPTDLELVSDDLSGNVGLVSFSYTNIDWDKVVGNQRATDFSITGQIGRGGAYVGESQAFAPDQLFLSKFAGTLSDPDAPIGVGLANKWYYGVVATTPKLDWLSLGKGVATLKIHHYRLAEARGDHTNLGTEASLDVRIEQPKGVRYQATFAGFQPGAAIDPSDVAFALVRKFQYVFKFNVTVRME
jgi:hypothetical protein